MILYSNHSSSLKEVKEKPFKLEKEIQKLFEVNLKNLSGLQLIKSEFTVKSSRIDTLAFDEENKAFIIIEYKREKNYSVIDQGVSYLNLMLEYKADFIVEYNESLQKTLKREEVDWSQSKVIFVSSSFTDFQKQSTNFKDLSIELWEFKQYENDVIIINAIKKTAAAPSIKPIANHNEQLEKVAKEIKTYTEEDHLQNKAEETKELYETYKNAILNLDSGIELVPNKTYIAFKKRSNIADIAIMKKGLKLWINLKKEQIDDPKKLARDVSEIGHYGNGHYELNITEDTNLEYVAFLIKQALV